MRYDGVQELAVSTSQCSTTTTTTTNALRSSQKSANRQPRGFEYLPIHKIRQRGTKVHQSDPSCGNFGRAIALPDEMLVAPDLL